MGVEYYEELERCCLYVEWFLGKGRMELVYRCIID
jgi:hypothetical protein